jgi:hypothetical protein
MKLRSTVQIDKGANIAVIVERTWVNLHGVKMFLRPQENPQTEIRGVDESHIIFGKVLDGDDTRGVWIEVIANSQKQESTEERFILLVPWSQVLSIVVANQFSPAIRLEARRIGFTGETDREYVDRGGLGA